MILEHREDIMAAADDIINHSNELYSHAPLSDLQQEDISAIRYAAEKFRVGLIENMEIIIGDGSYEQKRKIRHDLKNHMNIVLGFSSVLINELPDNLLLYMHHIREIYSISNALIKRIDAI